MATNYIPITRIATTPFYLNTVQDRVHGTSRHTIRASKGSDAKCTEFIVPWAYAPYGLSESKSQDKKDVTPEMTLVIGDPDTVVRREDMTKFFMRENGDEKRHKATKKLFECLLAFDAKYKQEKEKQLHKLATKFELSVRPLQKDVDDLKKTELMPTWRPKLQRFYEPKDGKKALKRPEYETSEYSTTFVIQETGRIIPFNEAFKISKGATFSLVIVPTSAYEGSSRETIQYRIKMATFLTIGTDPTMVSVPQMLSAQMLENAADGFDELPDDYYKLVKRAKTVTGDEPGSPPIDASDDGGECGDDCEEGGEGADEEEEEGDED